MEEGLIGQLGIDWKLLASQAVNFFILLFILRAFVLKPLLAVIKKRNEKIKDGLEKAKEADNRLREIDGIAESRLKKAEAESIVMIKNTEDRAKQLEEALKVKAEERQKKLAEQIELSAKMQLEESKQNILNEAAELVKKIIVKTVELKPEIIDDALISKAISQVKKNEI